MVGKELLLEEIIPSNTPKSLESGSSFNSTLGGQSRVTTQEAGQASENSESSRAVEAGSAGDQDREAKPASRAAMRETSTE